MSDVKEARAPAPVEALNALRQYARSLVEAVFARPRIYTINGTLEEVAAFLEGFYRGMATYNPKSAAQARAQHWVAFCQWAAQQLAGTESGHTYALFRAVRRLDADDVAAFRRLRALYIAFYDGLETKPS